MSAERTTAWPALAGGPQFVAIDSNGNLASKVEDGHSWTYEWNAEDRLTRVLKDAVEVARFGYDPLGRRVEKVAGGVTTAWAYNGDNMLRQTSAGVSRRWVQGPGFDDPLAAGNGSGQLAYEHADGLGSELKITDAAGAVTPSRSYDAFGQLQASAVSGYAFTGREWDAETSLYYYRARYYDPRIGRFASEDPLRFAGSRNFFAYVRNRPTDLLDPTGLCDTPNCQVTVRCRLVHAWRIKLLAWATGITAQHCYVVSTDPSGGQTTYTAGESNGTLSASVTQGFPTGEDSADDNVVLRQNVPCDALPCLAKNTRFFNRRRLEYRAMGPNCNSFANGLLFGCGIPPAQFPPNVFGGNYFLPPGI